MLLVELLNKILFPSPTTFDANEAEEAFPEKHMTKKQRGRPAKVNLKTYCRSKVIQM